MIFADLWRRGLDIFGSKNDSAPALLYSKYCTASFELRVQTFEIL